MFQAFLLILFLFHEVASDRVVYVNQKIGNDVKCLQEVATNTTPCQSLGYVASQLGIETHGLNIVIQSDLQLNDTILFADSTSLRLETDTEVGRVLTNSTKTCGLQFINITNLTISGLSLSHCEFALPNVTKMNRTGSVHIHQSTNLFIENIQITNMTGTGLVLSDIQGSSVIEHSSFMYNNAGKVTTINLFAGGIHIQFSKNTTESVGAASLVIRECRFINNTQPQYLHIAQKRLPSADLSALYGYGNGGGMSVIFMGMTQGIEVLVDVCEFRNNTGHSGAGLYIHFQDNSTNNTVIVNNSRFERNSAAIGGGMSIGMGKQRVVKRNVTSNNVSVLHTMFVGNRATYGGGTALYAIHSTLFSWNRGKMMRFSNCTWTQNSAHYSSAIDIAPFQYDRYNQGFLPSPAFKDCNFIQNVMNPGRVDNYTEYRSTGVFVVTSFSVLFEGRNFFARNRYTALRLTSATVILRNSTKMIFDSNEGLKGGAIAMYGFSALKGREDCEFLFLNNSASEVGGAIFYQPFEQREFIEGKSCFIQYVGEPTSGKQIPNLTFTFRNNSATMGGTAIFASSFYSCFYAHLGSLDNSKLTDFFPCIGHFEFEDGDNETALGTEGNQFVLYQDTNNGSLSTIPGKRMHISLIVQDEFNHTVQIPMGLEIKNVHNSRNPPVDRSKYNYFTGNKTRLYGHKGDIVNLVFNTQNIREAYYNYINVTFLDCPPGYYLDNSACRCSAERSSTALMGIPKCNSSEFRAYIQRDYWAGYYENHLFTAPCTFQVCVINSAPGHYHLLPANSSHDVLNHLMCGESKRGILCGECSRGFSAYFHSNSHKCGPKGLCDYSAIFYILSEIVPVVILFTLIIHFNISLTAGGISGFVFFSQMVVLLPTDIEKILHNSDHATVLWFKSLQTGYTLIYNILNFDFFSIDELSFCLWSAAKVMDVLVVKYATTLFTLVLIYILKCIMNSRWYMRRNKNKKPRSVVHGLSAFLILSFSQCASITFKILSRNVIRSKSGVKSLAVTHYGGLFYLKKDHIPYAIPAIFSSIFLVILPPMLLLVYPLILQLLSLCKLSEHRLTQNLLNAAHIHRLTPLFDSFQSCYKDKLRFFAGLYFVYKVLLLMCRSFTNNLTSFFATAVGTIFFILGIHALAQPYKQRVHNIIDSCLFLNLGVIVGISAYNHYLAGNLDFSTDYWSHVIVTMCTIQMVLVYIPILVVFIWCASLLVRRKRRRGYQRMESFHNSEGGRDVVHAFETSMAHGDSTE